MILVATELLQIVAKSLCAVLPKAFTGKVTITLNFHGGTAASATVGYEEGTKL